MIGPRHGIMPLQSVPPLLVCLQLFIHPRYFEVKWYHEVMFRLPSYLAGEDYRKEAGIHQQIEEECYEFVIRHRPAPGFHRRI